VLEGLLSGGDAADALQQAGAGNTAEKNAIQGAGELFGDLRIVFGDVDGADAGRPGVGDDALGSVHAGGEEKNGAAPGVDGAGEAGEVVALATMRMSSSTAMTRAAPARKIAWLSARMIRSSEWASLDDEAPPVLSSARARTMGAGCLQFVQAGIPVQSPILVQTQC